MNEEFNPQEVLDVVMCRLLDDELEREEISLILKVVLASEFLQERLLKFIKVNELINRSLENKKQH